MLAEGEHTGIEARVVRLKEGKIDKSAEAFPEHPMKRKAPLVSSGKGKACPKSTCYLEIEEEQDFAIVVTIKQPLKDKSTYWMVRVWVDGRYIGGEFYKSSTGSVLKWKFCEMTFHKGRKRMVGKLQLVDWCETTSVASEVSVSLQESDVGTIKVTVEAGMKGGRKRARKELKIKADVGIADEVKAKHVGSAVRSTKATVAPKRKPVCHWTPRSDGKLKHEFRFSYQTRAVLEALDVIPPPLLPTLPEDHGDEDDVKDETDSLEDDGQEGPSALLAINKALEERMAKRNRENAELRRALKRIRGSNPQEPKQIVDLTGDDSD